MSLGTAITIREGAGMDWKDVCAVAAKHAEAVDREGRFPIEAVTALKTSGALGIAVPKALGGEGASMARLARMARDLGAACASTAMVFAMHHNQLACLVGHHDGDPWQQAFLARVAAEPLLLASVTSEEGIGGRIRTSRCAIQPLEGGRFRLDKEGSTISYGADADAYLLTARAAPDADPSDQVLAVLLRDAVTLDAYRGWDALGMRGTGSGAFRVGGEGKSAQILTAPFARIAAETMVPSAHILWGGVWLGIASDVVARCRAFIHTRMRRKPGQPDAALPRLAEMMGLLQGMDARLRRGLKIYDSGRSDAESVEMILLKTSLSETALEIATRGMAICGFAAFRNDSPHSLGRHLRDLHGAPLMVGNEAILSDAGQLLLLRRPGVGNFDEDEGLQ